MRPSSMHYFPLAWPFLLALFVLFFVVVALIELGLLKYAYERMGVPPRYVLAVLLLSLLGSAVNIPVAELPSHEVVSGGWIDFYGVRYVIPVVREWPGTVVAVNVGGALIPTILSFYLLIKNRLWLRGLLSVAAVALVAHWLARPVPGLGISLPIFVPPIVAALTAVVIGRQQATPLAYVAGSLGTLIGADLTNLDNISALGAPVASIGGAGTFDGIFVAGIVAVLLAPVSPSRRIPRQSSDK
jgi:uncharacterized membrane protein